MSEDFPAGTHVEVQSDQVEVPQAKHKAEVMDESAEAFHNRMGQLMAEGRDIFVFRGAGTKNGIDEKDVPGAVEKIMATLRASLESGKKVAIMFDGDEDNRQKPDVGAVFGLVADLVKDDENVAAVAAQQESWYYPDTEGGELKSATGTPYETFVFPDSTPGGHASLTQSSELAQYEGYKQFFVGPAGAIAGDQLRDLNEKAQGRPDNKKVEVIAIATHNNPNLTQEFEDKAKAADEAGDNAKADGFRATLTQRQEQPYGMMYGADGYKSFMPSEYPNIDIKFDESIVGEFQQMRSEPLKESYVDKQKAETLAPLLYAEREEGDSSWLDHGRGSRIDENEQSDLRKAKEGVEGYTEDWAKERAQYFRDQALEPFQRLYDVNPDHFASMPTGEFIKLVTELEHHSIQETYVREREVEPAQEALKQAEGRLRKAQERLTDAQQKQEEILARYRTSEES